ncbi:hypothetical protein Hanom_Chr03g00216361 [Helianthus anomalus]
MANKSNLSGCFNILNRNGLQWYVDKYAIPASLHPVLPEKDTPIYPFVPGKTRVYTCLFDYCNYRLPLTKFLIEVILFHEVHLSQMNPFGLAKVCHFELACRGLGSDPNLDVFWAFYKLNRSGSCLKDWKDRFFLIDDRCVPSSLTWRLKKSHLPPPLPEDFTFNKDLYAALIKEVGRIQKYPEHILVMGRISTIWAEPEWYPTLKWNGEAMGLKEALRLKSFDSTEFDVRATRTPNGDRPYLSVVQENLYPIREPTALITQGVRRARVAQVHAEEEEEGDDDDGAEAQPQVSLKIIRNTSKPDPDPKILKKKKLDFHTITLDDDEVDQVTGFSTAGDFHTITLDDDEVDQVTSFSTAGGFSYNLHSGRTPNARPVTLPMSPLSFGGPATKVIEDIHMPGPLSFKNIELSPSGKPTTGVASNVSRPSPQPIDGGDSASSSPLWYETGAIFLLWELGSGDALDMDSTRASEKYIPEWSLANKYRIVDALIAKMALFHLETPAEHAHYWKMSGPEPRNALMLNQAQSNSLVVETYKLWVSEAKEVNKSSQSSTAAAYEARGEALQDLEAFKLKFGDLEKKLSDAEKRSKTELKEM